MSFDVADYSDAELFDLLDLNNPSDRVLEAKILMLIHKYQQMNTGSAKKLAVFFDDVYKHFFEVEEEEDDDDDTVEEGFANYDANISYSADLNQIYKVDSSGVVSSTPITNINEIVVNEKVMVDYNDKGVLYNGFVSSITGNTAGIIFKNSVFNAEWVNETDLTDDIIPNPISGNFFVKYSGTDVLSVGTKIKLYNTGLNKWINGVIDTIDNTISPVQYTIQFIDEMGNSTTTTATELADLVATDNTTVNPYKTPLTTDEPRVQNEKLFGSKPVLESGFVEQEKTRNVAYTQQLNYTSGTLNPILKQTTTRIISVDSQYRYDKRTMSTDFTFNLSEPLRDVVSLKLYSVQIPYTWYTISTAYGSNFFILKGKPNGINDGDHDIKFEISPGNYTPNTLVQTVQNSINNIIHSSDIDYDINGTVITYTEATSMCKIDISINKIYNENSFEIYFPSWSSPVPYETYNSLGNSVFIRNTDTIPAFLGIQTQNYEFNVIKTLPLFNGLIGEIGDYIITPSIDKTLANEDYQIHIIMYNGTPPYVDGTSTIIHNITIDLKSVLTTDNITYKTIFNELNSLFISNDVLIDSYIQFTEFDSVNYDETNYSNQSFIEFKIKFNRFKTKYSDNTHACVIFPNNNIWIGRNSVFKFDFTNNELRTILMETNTVEQTSNYLVSEAKINFTCNIIGYSDNKYTITLENGDYLLSEYMAHINSKINSITDLNGSVAYINSNSTFQTDIVINHLVSESNYYIIFGDVLHSKISGLNDININTTLTAVTDINGVTDYYTGSFDTEYIGYSISASKTIYKDEIIATIVLTETAVKYEIKYYNPANISDSSKTYANYISFENDINYIIQNWVDPDSGLKIFSGSTIISTPPTVLRPNYEVRLKFRINKVLVARNFSVSFIGDSWQTYLKIDNNMFDPTNYSLENSGSIDEILNKYSSTSGFENSIIYTYNNKNISIFGNERIDDNQVINIQTGINDTIQIVAKELGVYYRFSTFGSKNFTDNNITITIPPDVYSRNYLIDEINTQIRNIIDADTTLTKIIRIAGDEYFKIIKRPNSNDSDKDFLQIKLYLLRKYVATDFNLVFYDNLSFATCYTGVSSVRNTVWDTTLGWILGFRTNTVYNLTDTDIDFDTNNIVVNLNNSVSVMGDTGLTTNLYNYFLLCLDDFNQNHLNDGLVTITNNDTSIPLPSYANRTAFICDPVTGEVQYTNTEGLTASQIYTLNSINNTRVGGNSIGSSIASSSYGTGPFVKDVFGLIPIKTAGLQIGSTFVEYGGTLQNQERSYFGPVNIHRMSVKLISDRGDVVNLNRANWSFSLVCEQLNKLNPNGSGGGGSGGSSGSA